MSAWLLGYFVFTMLCHKNAVALGKIRTSNYAVKEGRLFGKMTDLSGDRLVLVHAVWRHGDRTPTRTFKTDPYKESSWPQGWGQLTIKGMEEQFVLGRKLRGKYIETHRLLSYVYDTREVYIRSTDFNRTLMSATANFIGFFGSSEVNGREGGGSNVTVSRANVDYPNVPGWPSHFVPFAIHTENLHSDHIGNLGPPCDRRSRLFNVIGETPEYKQLLKERKELFERLTELCGEPIYPHTIGALNDVLNVETIYDRLPEWATAEVLAEILETATVVERWSYGLGLKPFRGVDFAQEIRTLRGGPVLWEIIERIKRKAECIMKLENSSSKKNISEECSWLNHLKYYVYSAHDSTLAGLSAALVGNTIAFTTDRNPPYAMCITFEMWQRAGSTDEFYVKLFLWDPDRPAEEEITHLIMDCSGEDGLCTVEQLARRSQVYRPLPNIKTLCRNTELSMHFNGAVVVMHPAKLLFILLFFLVVYGIL